MSKRRNKQNKMSSTSTTSPYAYITFLEKKAANLEETVQHLMKMGLGSGQIGSIIVSDELETGQVRLAVSQEAMDTAQIKQEHYRIMRTLFDYLLPIKSKCDMIDALCFAIGAPGAENTRQRILQLANDLHNLLIAFNQSDLRLALKSEFLEHTNNVAQLRLKGVMLMYKDNGDRLRQIANDGNDLLKGMYEETQLQRGRPITWRQWLGLEIARHKTRGDSYERATRLILEAIRDKAEADRSDLERQVFEQLEGKELGEQVAFCKKCHHNISRSKKLASKIDFRRQDNGTMTTNQN